MVEKADEHVAALLARMKPDAERLSLGRTRQGAVSRGEQADYLPICFGVSAPGRQQFPKFNMREDFHNPPVMLFNQL